MFAWWRQRKQYGLITAAGGRGRPSALDAVHGTRAQPSWSALLHTGGFDRGTDECRKSHVDSAIGDLWKIDGW